MASELKRLLCASITKALLIDLEDGLRGEALKAFTVVRDHTGLDLKRARESEGQLRFRMMEHRFEVIAELHGWLRLEGGVIPGTELKVFQPFLRKEIDGQGIILGLAAIPESTSLPPVNKSRKAGVTLNYDLVPRLDFDGTGPKIGDIFVLLVVARDRGRAGHIEEVAIGIIDAEYEAFVFYETLDKFLSDDEETPGPMPTEPPKPPSAQVALKKNVSPFIPPEKRNDEGGKTGTK
ncbi:MULTISPECIES: hypothetical protein [Asticcacaulis]|uniref:hypothetical protein n=1 Tax=Asticcacaulis TaxID=76890 RepID=UPI001AE9C5E9|nr:MULTISPECIES: hypothetical protein [Asticcacaulis]MBP2160284.1 hypothetical protein [Asticcacaulis solisilvae]MDR6801413.1 hypothetical protein [Asticcacaulis sp. BE141]